MKRLESLAALLFGASFLLLAVAVAVETTMRKVFNQSLQGVDELGGYILAAGAGLAMATALVGRAHIRIDLLHDRLPRALRLLLNLLAMAALFTVALALARMAWIALEESRLFNSTAQTPWATPLAWPQTAWFAVLALFAAVALVQLVQALLLLLRGRAAEVDRVFGPRGAREELEEELQSLKERQSATVSGETRP